MSIRTPLQTRRTYASIPNITIVAFGAMMLFIGPVAAAPIGGGGGSTAGYEAILANLYDVIYMTLRYAGLTTLVAGVIIWLTAGSSQRRAATGRWLTVGGALMTILYFALGAIIALLEAIAGAG